MKLPAWLDFKGANFEEKFALGCFLLSGAVSMALAFGMMLGPKTRRHTGDMMELSIVNVFVFGPVFLLGLFIASKAAPHRHKCYCYGLIYPAGWLLAIAAD